jgi:hypothetical protein
MRTSHSVQNVIRSRRHRPRRTLQPGFDGLEARCLLANFMVTNTNASGTGSLVRAILDANAAAGADTIEFNIAGQGPHTITSALPNITDPVTIDGYTQPGARPNTLAVGNDAALMIELDGTNAGSNVSGIRITAAGGGSTIRGLAINRFRGSFAQFSGFGIYLDASNGNVVEGNFIGTDITGMTDAGNAVDGVFLRSAGGNRIGGVLPAQRNVISGNGSSGVNGFGARNNLFQGNYIGLNAPGTAALGNSNNGLYIESAQLNTVGGTAPGTANVISGNTRDGVTIVGFSSANQVLGNLIGVDASGTAGLGNSHHGVRIGGSAGGNSIGGLAAQSGNTIAHNGGDGVFVEAAGPSTGNSIFSNAIFSNSGLGIDLEPNGVTPNDAGDTDSGANNLQNFPVLTSAVTGAAGTSVTGSLNSTPNTTFTLQFFSNPLADGSGFGEGRTYIGSLTVTTDSSGAVSFTTDTLAALVAAESIVTATASDPSGNTSEYSLGVASTFATTGGITGAVWHDVTADGLRNALEPGLPGWIVFLDQDHDQVLDLNETYAATDAAGNYAFAGLQPGDYEIAQLVQPGWSQTFPVIVPEWVYVSGSVHEPGSFEWDNWVMIGDFDLHLVDFLLPPELDGGIARDIEIGPGGDVYVFVQKVFDSENDRIVQFTYQMDFVRVIDIADDEPYAPGFDVLPDGSLLMGHPASHEVLHLYPDGSIADTFDFQIATPSDVGMTSDGVVVFDEDNMLNVRPDDRIWASGDTTELRDVAGTVFAERPASEEALEASDGSLFMVARGGGRVIKLDAAGEEIAQAVIVSDDIINFASALAVARNEVPYGDGPVRGGGGVVTSQGTRRVRVEAGQVTVGADFGNVHFSTVSGTKFNDENQDGVRDPDEPGLDGWVIYADLDDDGHHDAREPFDTTHDGGLFMIGTILPGTYKLREVPQVPWVQTAPALGYYEVVSSSGSVGGGLDFGNFLPLQVTGEIRGTVWHDVDTTGTRESGEPGVAGWTVFLDGDNDGQLDPAERTALTDSSGQYVFSDVAPGSYSVVEFRNPGWHHVFPLDVPEWVFVTMQRRWEHNADHVWLVAYDAETLEEMDRFAAPQFYWTEYLIPIELDWITAMDVEASRSNAIVVVAQSNIGPMLSVYGYWGGLSWSFESLIHLPDDPRPPEEDPFPQKVYPYPYGFDVLPNGDYLVAQPNSQRIVQLDRGFGEWEVVETFDLPGSRPLDAAMTSDGFLVWTEAEAEEPEERLVNVRFDDRFWVATGSGAELRDFEGNVHDSLEGFHVNDALELFDGSVVYGGGFLQKRDNDGRVIDSNAELPHGVFGFAVAASLEIPRNLPRALASPSSPPEQGPHGSWNVQVAPGQSVSGIDFGIVQLSTASGVKYLDSDGDGSHDPTEPGLNGWTVWVDLDDDGYHDGFEPDATTSGGGYYTISGILPGTHQILEDPQPGWKRTAPPAGHHEIHVAPGSASTGLDFGSRPCPADWLVREGGILRILGDSQDNTVNVTADPAGRLTVANESDCFYEFSGIRRIVAELKAGNDSVSLLGSGTGGDAPIDVELRTDQGDDVVQFDHWDGDVTVDLGAGDDAATMAIAGMDSPDPSSLHITLAAGLGDDEVNLTASALEVFVDLDLGAGDDQFDLTLSAGSPQVDDPTSIVHMNIDGGAGLDGMVIDTEHFTIAQLLAEMEAIIESMEALTAAFAESTVVFRQLKETSDLTQKVRESVLSLRSDRLVLTVDLTTGDSDDLIEFEMDPAADGSVRFSANTGPGDDTVHVTVPTHSDAFLDIDLGEGNDRALIEEPVGTTRPAAATTALRARISGGPGDDVLAGSSGDDFISGGDGSDTFVTGGGTDTVDGGDDTDLLIVRGTPLGDRIELRRNGLSELVQKVRELEQVSSLTSVEETRVDADAGDDFVLISEAGLSAPATAAPMLFRVKGGPHVTGDRLQFVERPGEAGIVRPGQVPGSGTISVGAATRVVYEGIENLVDTTPPVRPSLQLAPGSDTGMPGRPATLSDRITSRSQPSFLVRAEPGSTVRLYIRGPNGESILADEETAGSEPDAPCADPTPGVQLEEVLCSIFTMGIGQLALLTLFPDGALTMASAIADDRAGNHSAVATIEFLFDPLGPQVRSVVRPDGVAVVGQEAFGPTPLLTSLDVTLFDPAAQSPTGPPGVEAIDRVAASNPANYALIGDHVGIVPLRSIEIVTPVPTVAATITARLHFDRPLPDDQYRLLVGPGITDAAGNPLFTPRATPGTPPTQEQSGTLPPPIQLPSCPPGTHLEYVQSGLVSLPICVPDATAIGFGGFSGGGLGAVTVFAVDTRPEIGTYYQGSWYIDLNGNGVFDPGNGDSKNHDIVWQFGRAGDVPVVGDWDGDGYDEIGVFGFRGTATFELDANGNGTFDPEQGDITFAVDPRLILQPKPIAGNFNPARPGDELGFLFFDRWVLDLDGDHVFGENRQEAIFTNMRGQPLAGNWGDFDLEGRDHVAAYRNGQFQFDMDGDFQFDAGEDIVQFRFDFPGGDPEIGVAADWDGDGNDTIGLFVTDRAGVAPHESAEWYLDLGYPNDNLFPGDGHFEPPPTGRPGVPADQQDIFYRFGDESARPIVGNFDPPPPSIGQLPGDPPNSIGALEMIESPMLSPRSPRDEHPNRVGANAARLAWSVSGGAAADGAIDVAGDKDVFQFTATQSGRIAIEVTTPFSNVDTRLTVLGSKRRVLARNDDFGAGTDSLIETDVVAGQNYFVVVEGKRRAIGVYALTVDHLLAGEPDPGAPNGELQVTGRVAVPGGASVYRFIPTISGNVAISVRSEDFGPVLEVFDSTGHIITRNGNGTRLSATSRVEFEAGAGDTYFIRIRGRGEFTGDFELVIDVLEDGL